MRDFKQQLAFITGGASGAGFGQALVFGQAGAKIVIADIRPEPVAKAVSDLKKKDIEVHGVVLDVTDRVAYARAADEVDQVFGCPPTMLFNTAGVNSFGLVENTTYGDFDWLIGVNLGGVINGMVTFVPRMIKAGKPGHIVTTSSVGGLMGSALAAPYSAAKAAVVNLMESYRQGLEKYGIGVSVVCPANIKSNIAEATKLRPAHFGASGHGQGEAAISSLHSIHQHGMEPVQLATFIKQGIEANQLYIIPYPETKDQLRTHFDAIVDSVLPMEADAENARKRVEALQNWMAGARDVFTEPKK